MNSADEQAGRELDQTAAQVVAYGMILIAAENCKRAITTGHDIPVTELPSHVPDNAKPMLAAAFDSITKAIAPLLAREDFVGLGTVDAARRLGLEYDSINHPDTKGNHHE
jgi:hypothetical protein